MKNRIITINREFGSGGREVGKRLADILQIPYYDNEIVTQIAKRTDLAEEYVNQITEKKPYTSFPITTGRSFYPMVDPTIKQAGLVYREQSKLLEELASQSDCIIVGRCANYILKKFDPLRIFIYADMDAKMCRCREKAPEHEHLTDKELKKHISSIDKNRAGYYKSITGEDWSEKTNYDLCINTTFSPIKDVAQIIADYSTNLLKITNRL